MVRHRLPPTFIPGTPSSQPGMTCPWPSWKVKGERPGCRLESKDLPSVSQPVYWTSAFCPRWATSPVPTFRSATLRPSGYVTPDSCRHVLKSSAPGDALGPADGPALSFAIGGVAAHRSEEAHGGRPSSVRPRIPERASLHR